MTRVPLHELPEYARNVRAVLKLLPKTGQASVVYLEGQLGAGKTTFVQALGRELGIPGVMQSPTYVLMKSYQLPADRTPFGGPRRFLRVVHIDAYRLESPKEFAALKLDEVLADPATLVLIEWPERAAGVAPKADLVLTFAQDGMGEHERNITMREVEHR